MRGEFKADNQLAKALTLPLRGLPDDVLNTFIEKHHGDVFQAFHALLTGSAHVCEHCNCQRPNHQSIRLFFELAGKIGQSQTLIVNLIGQLGARDLEEATRLIAQGKELQKLQQDGVTDEQAIEDATEVLSVLLRRHPGQRLKVMAKLGGAMVETNGTGHEGEMKP